MRACDWTLVQARQALKVGLIGCEEYVQELLQNVLDHQDLNVWVTLDVDAWLMAARRADERRVCRDPSLLLGGIALAIKDNINTRDLPTTGATRALRHCVPSEDAAVVHGLLRAGALLAGKTNMHELALGITNNNAVTGATRNPWNPSLMAGGSSGGSAVAVATRMVPAALGTDTGGSVRLPAALCGVVGFRPSTGRYSPQGVMPLSHTRDTVGTLARSVADLRLLDRLLMQQTDILSDDYSGLSGVRLGVPKMFYEHIQEDVMRCVDEAFQTLQRAGVDLVEVDAPDLRPLNDAVGFPVVLHELVRDLPAYLAACGYGVTLEDVARQIGSPDVAAIVRSQLGDQAVSAATYAAALASREHLQMLYAQLFWWDRLDALVFPTSPMTARPIGDDDTVECNGQRVPTFAAFIRNTDPGSNAGLPGVSLPIGLTPAGLPVGLELDAPQGADGPLLALAQAMEMVLPPMPMPGRRV